MAKRTVLIGINKYQVPGANLQGCVNDVKNLSGMLKTLRGQLSKAPRGRRRKKDIVHADIQEMLITGVAIHKRPLTPISAAPIIAL